MELFITSDFAFFVEFFFVRALAVSALLKHSVATPSFLLLGSSQLVSAISIDFFLMLMLEEFIVLDLFRVLTGFLNIAHHILIGSVQ